MRYIRYYRYKYSTSSWSPALIRARTTDPWIPRTRTCAWSFDLRSGKIVSKSCQAVVWLTGLYEFSATSEVSGRALINSRLTLGTLSRCSTQNTCSLAGQQMLGIYLFTFNLLSRELTVNSPMENPSALTA